MRKRYSVIVPWRETEERKPLFDWCKERWEGSLPRQAELIVADSDFEHFNLPAARNQGFYKSLSND